MSEKELAVKVFRFDPSRDREPYYQTFQVPYQEQETVLGVLDYIRLNLDPGLAYRDSCDMGCCAICSVRLNGKAVLSCQTSMPDGDMVIDPINKDKVRRDLICG